MIKNKLKLFGPIKYWGSFTCRFCKQRVIAYNHDRHMLSKKHLAVLQKQNVVQVKPDFYIICHSKNDYQYFKNISHELK